MSKPSKQLGALLGGTPRTTAPNAAPVREPVAYATKAVPTPSISALPDDEEDILLQVFVPRRVRKQMDIRHAEQRKSLRIQVLEALRAAGFVVTDDDLIDRRKKRHKS